ncbi:penicillin-binding protein 1A [Listeria ivanovii]|uniref:penicillin-binding protein 1A n=1 Tax=Listeria ivanovii TaxID=1638 RepID=UPI0005126F0C|nr:penicillin-binding protein 1A [Listeria ivanovii]AIS63121.1 penicillin-binding protein [Listeria ivanovii subsp. londoniensis]MBK1966694.1 penicillin-binding protein 1A [Listeria ivanovii subsp. londoniensis]MBK1984119.1 penicillin-binding protein 1A [Listeria ivanovii subsp. londoniensis]MBK1996164.1 penicillin-binding protein 1A [Listeria ivanovii subsp. londoniensis]MBK2001749.1 penicillin-binding protein 1A [Listeria ivanovii subsp. londoniensis]
MADKPQTRSQYRNKQNGSSKKNPSKRGKRVAANIFKTIFFTGLFLAFFGVAAGATVFYNYAKDAPKLTDSKLRDPLSSKLLDKDGKVFAEVGTERREYIEYKDIPDTLKDAILTTEDARFYEHDGIDPIRLGGAVIANFKDGFGSEGASTLSQQIIKMSYLDYTNKTLARKAQEAWLALQLEEKYSKDDILEIYVNKVYMSDRVHGMQTASEHYFGKNLNDLTLAQTALIAGMPQSPNNYNPYDHPEAAKKRRDQVLTNMYSHDKITKDEMTAAQKTPINTGLRSQKDREDKIYKYDSYVTQVLSEIPKEYDVYRDGLTIYTALDRDAQEYTEKMLNTNEIVNFTDDEMQAGIVLQDTKTGRVQAIGGGRNQTVTRGYNYATQVKRSVGSTMKPIADYGPAFEYLDWSTAHILEDEPYTYTGGTPINNWDFGYKGPISVRQALYQSRNIPALKTLQAVGLDKSEQFVNKLGITYDEGQNVESNAIGANSSNPMQMAGAYAAFGNKGIYNKPHTVTKIVLSDGQTEIDTEPKSTVAMKESTAYMVSDVLKDVLTIGTGTSAAVPGLKAAGKTGTTNIPPEFTSQYYYPSGAARDSWFAGYTTNYSIAVWTGYDDKKKYVSPSEQKIAQYMFSKLMAHASEGKTTEDFKMPSNVVSIPILKGSNPVARAASGTSSDKVSYELFIAGTAPTKTASTPEDEKKTKEAAAKKKAEEDKKKQTEEEKKKAEEEAQKKAEEEAKNKEVSAPTSLKASYDGNSKQINVSWAAVDGATYEVTVNGTTTTVSSTSVSVSGGNPGDTISISVIAQKDGNKSPAASTTVKIPAEESSE